MVQRPMTLTSPLLQQIASGIGECESGAICHETVRQFRKTLRGCWNPTWRIRGRNVPQSGAPTVLFSFDECLDDESRDRARSARAPRKRPPPWYIGMSSSFSKDITHIDRKLQGRILEALVDLAAAPITVRGDTVKPLSRELAGKWRYRIGDYRVIYLPDQSTGDVTLLAFDSRGSIYED